MEEFEDEVDEVEATEERNVLLGNIDLEVYILDESEQRFLGACLDTGATVSLIGRNQAEAY